MLTSLVRIHQNRMLTFCFLDEARSLDYLLASISH